MGKKIVVIGGGIYGCWAALRLAQKHSVTIMESSSKLCGEATYVNQARIHNGCHYPRDYQTAKSCQDNLPRFIKEFGPAIDKSFKQLYHIDSNSLVTTEQFEDMMRSVECPLIKIPNPSFATDRIEASYEVIEYGFNGNTFRRLMTEMLELAGVTVRLNAKVKTVLNDSPMVVTKHGGIYCDEIIIATYASTNHLLRTSNFATLPLKHEFCEVVLVDCPELKGKGITIMDGPYFSIMPFAARDCHSLTHVRFTPHFLTDCPDENPTTASNYDNMINDIGRYVDLDISYIESLWAYKAIFKNCEATDARPVGIHMNYEPNIHVIIGGKLNNIYDLDPYLENL